MGILATRGFGIVSSVSATSDEHADSNIAALIVSVNRQEFVVNLPSPVLGSFHIPAYVRAKNRN